MWYWWALVVVVWLSSAICIISTMIEMKQGKTGPRGPHMENFWGAVLFHGSTAVLVIWLLTRALAK
jgi:hypothetical protein